MTEEASSTALIPVPHLLARTTIHSLPHELILVILEEGCRAAEALLKPENASDFSAIPLRYPFLCVTSLICRDWTQPSIALLQRRIYLHRTDQASGLLNSASFGKYQTDRLAIEGGSVDSEQHVGSSQVAELVSKVKGLKHLELWAFGHRNPLDFSILCSPNLSHLVALELDRVHTRIAQDHEQFPQFALTFLHLEEYTSNSSSRISCFGKTPATTLHFGTGWLDDLDETEVADVVAYIKLIGSQLRGFSILENNDLIVRLIPLFTTFTKLQNLELECSSAQLASVLGHLPSPLSTLAVALDPYRDFSELNSWVTDLTSKLSSNYESTSRLTELNLTGVTEEGLKQTGREGIKLREAASTRGIGLKLRDGRKSIGFWRNTCVKL